MDAPYYARPVTVTQERLQEALEKQAKQKALREALNSQMREQQERKGLEEDEVVGRLRARRRSSNNLSNSTLCETHSGTPVELIQNLAGYPGYQGNGYQGNGSFSSNGGTPVYITSNGSFGVAPPYSAHGGQVHPLSPSNYGVVPTPPSSAFTEQQHIRPMVMNALANSPPLHSPSAPAPTSQQFMSFLAKITENPPTIQTRGSELDAKHSSEGHTTPNSVSPTANGKRNGMVSKVSGDKGGKEKPPSRQTYDSDVPKSRQDKRTSVVEQSKVNKLEQQLHSKASMVEKLMEREKEWEQQVARLKADLKHAKIKERQLSKEVRSGSKTTVPDLVQRAETAEARPTRGPAPHREAPPRGGKKVQLAPLRGDELPPRSESGALNATVRLDERTFRPITAPNALEPIEVRETTQSRPLPPLPEALKSSSWIGKTIKPLNSTAQVSLAMNDLYTFCATGVVSWQQAESLWNFLAETARRDLANAQQYDDEEDPDALEEAELPTTTSHYELDEDE